MQHRLSLSPFGNNGIIALRQKMKRKDTTEFGLISDQVNKSDYAFLLISASSIILFFYKNQVYENIRLQIVKNLKTC